MVSKKKLLWTVLLITAIVFAVVTVYWLFLSHQANGSFGIFLLENNKQVLSDEDIVWYNLTSHEIKLTQAGAAKIENLSVPVYGSQFAAKLDDKVIYNGTFMTPISSVSIPPSVIVIETQFQNCTIRVQIGYPSTQPTGEDPRINSELFSHFQYINKLVH